MKSKISWDLVFILILLLSLFSCTTEETPERNANSLVGPWKPQTEGFIQLLVNGTQTHPEQFGIEVLGVDPSTAADEAKKFLSQTLLGPISWEKEQLTLFADGSFMVLSVVGEETGGWKMLNNNSVFQLTSDQFPDLFYDFQVDQFTNSQLILSKKVELSVIGPETEKAWIELKIHLNR